MRLHFPFCVLCMGFMYELVNLDKQERLTFERVNTGTKKIELSGTAVSGNLVTYYLLKNAGDRITFVDDTSPTMTLFGQEYADKALFGTYLDVTQTVIEELLALGILRDDGIRWIDQEEGLFFRDLRNVFDPHCAPNPDSEGNRH
jgi:hypothetical protein